MSMLTPPGMGGKYRITGNRYPRMRRRSNRRRLVLVSLAAFCALALGGWGTLQLIDIFTGGSSASAAGSGGKGGGGTECAADTKAASGKESAKNAELPEPGSIEVNVLNATDRGGLAKSTADDLEKRGFKIGEVANAPAEFDKKVDNTGLVLGAPGEDGVARLKVLGTQFEDVDTQFDDRKGEDVDFVIGKDYDELAKEKEADAALTALSNPRPSPSGSRCAK